MIHLVDSPSLIWYVDQDHLLSRTAHATISDPATVSRWLDEVDASRGVFITALGLLMYFQPDEVRQLIISIAERLPSAEMAFDVIPPWLVRIHKC
jgi:O-methyltransferase involved in polyketide biosynthesis